jgi:hypothetical protein
VDQSDRYDAYNEDDDHGEDDSQNLTAYSGGLAPLDTQWNLLIQRADGRGITSVHDTVRAEDEPPPGRPGERELPPSAPDIEHLMTTPLEDPAYGQPRVSPIFQQRYGEPGQQANQPPPNFADAGQSPSPAEGNTPMRARRHSDEAFTTALQQRRAEDERMTGRRWPGNGIAYPGSAQEAMYFDQLAIALGQVDPRTLARESALRYVRSARLHGDDDLAATDIYAVLYYGLGLTLRPLDCTGLPHVLAVYHRATREVYLDWQLLNEPPVGRAALDSAAWRRAVDGSPLARVLLAWCAATHLSDNYDVPLVLGFSPRQSSAFGSNAMGGAPGSMDLGGDTLNRYRKAMLATATLLAPADRLWQQILALRMRVRMGDPKWRVHLRAEFGYQAGWAPAGGQAASAADASDPVEQLLAVLAERNNCPRMLVEAQLDGTVAQMDWGTWSVQLLREIPVLEMRYAAAAQMFHMNNAAQAPAWALPGRAPEVQPIHVQLSW